MADQGPGEKTEEATQKKIDDARKEGNVPKSMDMAGFVALAAAVLAFVAMMGFLFERLMRTFRYSVEQFNEPMDANSLAALGLASTWEVVVMVVPLALVVAVFGVAGYLIQFGFLFTTKPLKPDIKKIDPIKGLGNLFSMQKLLDGLKITAKVGVAMAIMGWFLWGYTADLVTVHLFGLGEQLNWLLDKALILSLVMLLIFFVFAVVDLSIVRYFHFKKLRMSKQEIKDEFKNTEGSPEVKSRIRRLQMEMSRNRMMSDIPTADVVVTNPTHFAVALRYKQGQDRSPVVVAKGADLVALKIKEIAREHKIQIVENAALARELYKLVDVGEAIPEKLFGAVAEVLAYVYRVTNKKI